MTDPAAPLTNSRHEAFALAVARGSSATSAYIEAGYASKSAGRNGARLLKNDYVSQRIEHLKALAVDEGVMTANEILSELSDIARNSPNVRDRLAALNSLGRYHGLFVDRIDHTTKGEQVGNVKIYLPDNGRDPGLAN